MNNLLNFLVTHSSWFLFALYVVLSLVLLFQNNPYQQNVYLTSANAASASVYKAMYSVTSYLDLRQINEDLQQRNAKLEMEVVDLRNQVNNYKMQIPDTTQAGQYWQQFDFVLAHVISNSVSQPYNYITIDRGFADGIEPEMGVVDQNGVVGIVNVCGKHSARIISLLNEHMKLSCKLKGSNYFGSLSWDGRNPYEAIIHELPRHATFAKGDTIITSGYSAVFPEGIMVGIVESQATDIDGNFLSLKVKLSTDFSRLSTVRAIKNKLKPELRAIAQKDDDETKE